MSTYYDILRVPEDADDKEIKAAYKQAALAYHPDHIPKGVSKRMRDDAAQTWLEIQEAFTVLTDPAKREEYDTLLEEMRQAEEAESQFEPETTPPAPQSPKSTPTPTPQEAAQQPAPQRRPITRIKTAWLWVCFHTGRHWRKLCFVATVVLFVANGSRDAEAWTVMSLAIILTSVMASFFIAAGSGRSWEDKRRYIVNAVTAIALLITGITAMSIPTPPSRPGTAPMATDHSATRSGSPAPTAKVPCERVAGEACVGTATPNKLVDTAAATKISELSNPQPPPQSNPITATAKESATDSAILSKDTSPTVARAGYIVLRSGERLHVIGYQVLGDKYRLQLTGGWMDVNASDVVAVQPELSTKETALPVKKWKNLRDGQIYETRLDGASLYLYSVTFYTNPKSEIASCTFHRAITVGLSWAGECRERSPRDQGTYKSDATITTFADTRIDMGTGDMSMFALIPAEDASSGPSQAMTSLQSRLPFSTPSTPVPPAAGIGTPEGGTSTRRLEISSLSGPERQSIESSCSQAKHLEGPAAYDKCLEGQLALLAAGPRRPDLSSLTGPELQSIESACSQAKHLEGPAAYNKCLNDQLTLLAAGPRRPDLSSLTGPELQSIESACSQAKHLEGPAAYNRCLRDQLVLLSKAPRRPDLSSLSGAELQSIESVCSQAKHLEGPAAYNRCLVQQLDLLKSSR